MPKVKRGAIQVPKAHGVAPETGANKALQGLLDDQVLKGRVDSLEQGLPYLELNLKTQLRRLELETNRKLQDLQRELTLAATKTEVLWKRTQPPQRWKPGKLSPLRGLLEKDEVVLTGIVVLAVAAVLLLFF